MEGQEYESTNINTLWLQNIYENLKNLEYMERIAREGCSSILEYLQIPLENQQQILQDTQYKNMKFMVTEMNLLLTDLTPVLDKEKIKEFRKHLHALETGVNNKALFVDEAYSFTKRKITSSSMTPLFYETISFITNMRVNIINEMASLLYVKKSDSIMESYAQIS